MLEHFEFYLKLGWQIVPLLANSKQPFLKGWTREYSTEEMRQLFAENKECNMGLKLGKIIDVEADDEKSNTLLEKLTSNKHPKYQSNKSVHHLFLSPSKSLTREVIYGIEFRGNLHQSVLPPSIISNTKYQWIDTADFHIPEMPEPLLSFYYKYTKPKMVTSEWIEPWCFKCQKKSRAIHSKRYNLEVKAFKILNKQWECHKCRNSDVKVVCRTIK